MADDYNWLKLPIKVDATPRLTTTASSAGIIPASNYRGPDYSKLTNIKGFESTFEIKVAHHPTVFVPTIKKIIFNEPATVVCWEDGTKTVVKAAEGEEFSKEHGLAMAIAKRYFQNSRGKFKKAVYKDAKDQRAEPGDPE